MPSTFIKSFFGFVIKNKAFNFLKQCLQLAETAKVVKGGLPALGAVGC